MDLAEQIIAGLQREVRNLTSRLATAEQEVATLRDQLTGAAVEPHFKVFPIRLGDSPLQYHEQAAVGDDWEDADEALARRCTDDDDPGALFNLEPNVLVALAVPSMVTPAGGGDVVAGWRFVPIAGQVLVYVDANRTCGGAYRGRHVVAEMEDFDTTASTFAASDLGTASPASEVTVVNLHEVGKMTHLLTEDSEQGTCYCWPTNRVDDNGIPVYYTDCTRPCEEA
jgi:hypothetical protein